MKVPKRILRAAQPLTIHTVSAVRRNAILQQQANKRAERAFFRKRQ